LTIEEAGTGARLQQPLESGRIGQLLSGHRVQRGGAHGKPAPDVNRNPEHDPSCLVDPVVQEDKRMEPDSSPDFVVEDLPGIGRSYQMTGTNGGRRITVVVHHGGRRVVYGLNTGADQASAVELSDHQAQKLGTILGGAFFKPASGGRGRGGLRGPAHRLGGP
jgi:hypothetical protein